jgi:sulfate transport system ATP-binding protein
MSIQIENIRKNYGAFEALKGISLTIESGELIALLGPSGCGKTTLLRSIAGLESPDDGHILLHGEESTRTNAARRGIGFVFQHYALFRHMTIFENVAFGLRVQPRAERLGRKGIHDRVSELLRLVQLESYARMYPEQLSGGQRQRVALARALAVRPKVLLLDEPFSALDAKVRKDLRTWLRRVHDELHVTTILVTHDQEEALEVADRVVILNAGRMEQVGTPEEIYNHPASPFVYNFLGNVNLFHGRLLADLAPAGSAGQPQAAPSIGFVRPHEFEIARTAVVGSQALPATVSRLNAAGPLVRLDLTVADAAQPVVVEISHARLRELSLREGDQVYLTPTEIRVFSNTAADDLVDFGSHI